MKLSDRETATILAALRYYQSDIRDDGMRFEFGDIATNSGAFAPMGEDEIDTLCERVNGAPSAGGEIMVCSHCGSPEVFFDAFAAVNDSGNVRTFDATHCEQCEGACSIVRATEFRRRTETPEERALYDVIRMHLKSAQALAEKHPYLRSQIDIAVSAL